MKKVYFIASLFFFIFTNPILSNENDIYKKIEPRKKKAEKMRFEKEIGERELADM